MRSFVDLSGLDKTMEGAHRPGHFVGVVQVVHRLLDIVRPNSLYMGQKDYQQFYIVLKLNLQNFLFWLNYIFWLLIPAFQCWQNNSLTYYQIICF